MKKDLLPLAQSMGMFLEMIRLHSLTIVALNQHTLLSLYLGIFYLNSQQNSSDFAHQGP
jgi:hypothetical protein